MTPRHLRFGRTTEDADDGATLIVPTNEWEPWWCDCGERIGDGSVICTWCGSERGDWVCERCAHKNRRRSECCEECGSARPEDLND